MEFHLSAPIGARGEILGPGALGGFSLYGHWRGQQLVLNDGSENSVTFRSGLKIEHPSVTLNWGTKSDFNAAWATIPREMPK